MLSAVLIIVFSRLMTTYRPQITLTGAAAAASHWEQDTHTSSETLLLWGLVPAPGIQAWAAVLDLFIHFLRWGFQCELNVWKCISVVRLPLALMTACTRAAWTPQVSVKPADSCYPSMTWQCSTKLLVKSQDVWLSQSSSASVNVDGGGGLVTVGRRQSGFFGLLLKCENFSTNIRPEGEAGLWRMGWCFSSARGGVSSVQESA